MIIKIYKFFQIFWEILYLPISLLYSVANYTIKDAEQEAERISNLIEEACKNWKEID